jgi:hypothetical protein
MRKADMVTATSDVYYEPYDVDILADQWELDLEHAELESSVVRGWKTLPAFITGRRDWSVSGL